MSTYFQGLNYSLANEDTTIEYELAPLSKKSFFSVCGSGSRVIPLIAKNPENMHIADLSETQLATFRLRFAAIKNLDYESFLFFLGYKKSLKNLNRVDLILKLGLAEEDLRLWKSNESLWKDVGFIYLGKWERHFMMIGSLFQKLSFSNLQPLFEAKNLQEQKQIIDKHWHPNLFKLYTKIVMNEFIANKLLYKGSYAGAKSNKTMSISAADFVFNEINDLFQNTWIRGNYFLSMIFLNEVSEKDSFPIECNEDIYLKVKSSSTRIHFHKKNLLDLLLQEPHDFYSLSDTFSYMKDEDVVDFLQKLPETIRPQTQIVIRTFMRKPTFNITPPWISDSQQNTELARKDCTRMYELCVLTRS